MGGITKWSKRGFLAVLAGGFAVAKKGDELGTITRKGDEAAASFPDSSGVKYADETGETRDPNHKQSTATPSPDESVNKDSNWKQIRKELIREKVDFESETRTFEISPQACAGFTFFPFSSTSSVVVNYSVVAPRAVDVFLFTETEFEQYLRYDQTLSPRHRVLSGVTSASYETTLDSNHRYYLIVDNSTFGFAQSGGQTVSATVKLGLISKF
jgi:hypothetical protein